MGGFAALVAVTLLFNVIYAGDDFPDVEGYMNFPMAQRRFPSSVFGDPQRGFNFVEQPWFRFPERGRHGPHHRGFKTKSRNETKGNMKIEEIEKDGDGYHSFSRLTTFVDPNMNDSETITVGKQQKFIDELAANVTKREECNGNKPCPDGKFCHPLSMSCAKKAKDGEKCFMKGQCLNETNGIKCIFGKCRKGEDGQAGAICSAHKECNKECCCTPGGSQMTMCRTRLDEGAICSAPMSFGGLFSFGKKRTKDTCNPCKDGLVCHASSGFVFTERSCQPSKYATKEDNDDEDDEVTLSEDDQSNGEDSPPQEAIPPKEADNSQPGSGQPPSNSGIKPSSLPAGKPPVTKAKDKKVKTKKEKSKN